MNDDHQTRVLLETVETALSLLSEYSDTTPTPSIADPLPSLLEQCLALTVPTEPEPLRTVHHFACTGGTVICKLLGALPNAVLLSEIDPLSTMNFWPDKPLFAPTDLVLNLRQSSRSVEEAVLVDVFLGGLVRMKERLAHVGQRLILRDHAHSQFCTTQDDQKRATLLDMLQPHFALRSLVTVRDPVDSYLSLVGHDWHRHFCPATLEEYAQRYMRFMDRHRDVPVIRYEDLLADPVAVLADMCTILALPHDPAALDLFPSIRLTGDSGRSGNQLAPRIRRAIPEALAREIAESPSLPLLCGRLGYDLAV
ncbi:Sulfotransferase family protein [Gemmobacter aquatilis]|uniref:Sulfotransferase family protein n=1 Tax=Gemmobacter aquatilis TaxID=933059 RepID=A0A1H8N157_9RHOB|nr:sulfotransferase [Gemmobacter aquatilis]SEO23337.1 Sulfotransferase family protein [Gemmobacter aquatilis]